MDFEPSGLEWSLLIGQQQLRRAAEKTAADLSASHIDRHLLKADPFLKRVTADKCVCM